MSRISRWIRIAALMLALLIVLAAMPLTAHAAYENTHTNTGNQAMDIVAVAKTQIGYVEGSNNYNKYALSFGSANQPWCGYFIAWCARQANIPTAIIPSTGLASAFQSIGTYHARSSGYIPQPGDIMMYDYNYNSSADHVSIVERYDASNSRVWVIDGNWSDKVSNHSASMSDGDVMGFVTPNYTSKVTELSAFNLVKPTLLLKGKSFSIGGMICSPHKLTKVAVAVKDAAGTTKISASAAPNDTAYDVSGLDSKVSFGSLAVGEYSYVVSATDSSGATKRWTNTFEIVAEITMTITGVKAPTNIEQGSTFSISGKITCLEALSTVSVSVYDAAGTYKTGGTANPGTTTYDINGIDKYVSFGSLAAGSYTMRVAARSANASKTWDYAFTVGGDPEFSVSGIVKPSTLQVGASFSIGGTVKCSHAMDAVSASVIDSTGARVISAAAAPKTTSYNLANLDSQLRFGSLSAGRYTYRVAARVGTVTKEWLYTFTVVGDAGDVNADGSVNAIDAMLLYSHTAGKSTLTSEQLARVGVTTVNTATAMRLYAYTAGKVATFP